MVFETLTSAGANVRWLNSFIDAKSSDKIGLASLEALTFLRKDIDQIGTDLGWPNFYSALAPILHRLISVLAYKAEIIRRWTQSLDGAKHVVGQTNLSPPVNGSVSVGRFDTLYAVIAAGLCIRSINVVETLPEETRTLLADVERLTIYDRMLSIADFSQSQVLYRALRFLFSGKIIGPRRNGPRILILRENEVIREMLAPLWISSSSLELIQPPIFMRIDTNPPSCIPDAERVFEALRHSGNVCDIDAPWKTVASIVSKRIHAASIHWRGISDAASTVTANWANTGRSTVLLSNALSGLPAHALTSHARTAGIPVVLAEHGVSAGLSKMHLPLRPIGEAAHCDRYLVCTENTARFFESDKMFTESHIKTIGLARQTRRIPLRMLQRFLARRKFGAKASERVVLYLGRAVQNNMRILPYSQEDDELYLTEKKIAWEILPRIKGIGIVKLYPTRRYLDPSPMTRSIQPPNQVKIIQWGDFRFLRAGADIIILESPLSTLGWAVATGKPIFYLAQPRFPLMPEVRDAMAQAFFYFDLSDSGWENRLIKALSMDDIDIAKAWDAKALKRCSFLDKFVFGPKDAGRNGAREVIDLA
jgi:hypothetical protein